MAELIRDYVTGKQLRLTAEEIVRQELEHILVDELGYPKELLDIEFPIQRGSKRKAEHADIVIFRSNKKSQQNIHMVIEVEAPGHLFDNQLLSYATATPAEYAIWFDGLEKKKSVGAKYFYRNLAQDPINFIEIPALPHYGETIEEVGHYKKSQLVPARSLKGLFQKMHNRLYGEGPLKREDEIAQEVIKILFCKLYDELHTPGETCEFRATVTELSTEKGRLNVFNRLNGVFNRLKSDPHYSEMFKNEELRYDPFWTSYIVSELQRFALTHEKTDTDAMGDAYEIFIGPQLKGESGQFFTPRTIVKMAVGIIQPSLAKRESIIDPASGSGGFLIYTLRSAKVEAKKNFKSDSEARLAQRVREYANNFIHGLELEPLLYKVAKSYMTIIGNDVVEFSAKILC